MSGFNFNPPKEFGDRSDSGLGALRSLHDLPSPPYAKVDSGDTVTIKGNGFDTVTRKPAPPIAPGRMLSEGRFNGSSGSTLVFAGNLRAPFKKKLLTVVGGDRGALSLGSNRTLVASTLDSAGIITLSRTKDFETKILEATTYMSVPIYASTFYSLSAAAVHMEDGLGNIIEYETETFSRLDGDNVLPKVVYSRGSTWAFAAVSGYSNYDHYTFGSAQLAPDVHMIYHAAVIRGSLYDLGARSATPPGTIPYPLFQVSRDGGASYTAINLDYLFAGSTYQYAFPAVAGTIGTAGLGGYDVIFTVFWMATPVHVIVSLMPQIDSPSAHSYDFGGGDFEPRIFRSDGFDLTAMAQMPIPPGFGTVWSGALRPAFCNSQPGPNFGTIGYLAFSVDPTQPNMLWVSKDTGLTWEAARPLPAIGYYADSVSEVTTRELTCSVYEATSPPQVVRYASTDFGLTWQRRQIIGENVVPLGPTDYLNDFNEMLVVTPDDGSLPSASPMSSWRFDSRLPRYTHV